MSQPRTMRANGTINVSRFVKIDTTDNNSVLECGANEKAFGIAQAGGREAPIPSVTADPVEAANDGDNVQVHTLGAECLLVIGAGGCTAGDYLKSDASGGGVAIASTQGLLENVGAIALETASAAELALVQVHIFTNTVDKT